MEEIKDLIKQEDYEKYKKLLQEFECKAIDIIEDLTYQFKETLAEDIDRKIKGWKDEYERLLKENWKKDDRIAELEQELAKYKELQDRLGFETIDELEYFIMLGMLTDNEKNMHILDLHRELAELKQKAIVPRFKLGQKVWYVYNKYQKFPFRCVIDKIVYDSSKNHKFRYDTSGELYIGIKEEDLFATEQEAQEKLKELQND